MIRSRRRHQAANFLSDVYAIGGRPVSALSILGYPGKGDLDDLEQILNGGASKSSTPAAPIGGHSVNDDQISWLRRERINPSQSRSDECARPSGRCPHLHEARWNRCDRDGAEARDRRFGARECGDRVHAYAEPERLRGDARLRRSRMYGCHRLRLIGHARELALASKVTIEIQAGCVQFLPGAIEYARQGAIPGGLKNDREFASCRWRAPRILTPFVRSQTSGGLLISLSENDAAAFEGAYSGAYRIGRVLERGEKPIRIL